MIGGGRFSEGERERERKRERERDRQTDRQTDREEAGVKRHVKAFEESIVDWTSKRAERGA